MKHHLGFLGCVFLLFFLFPFVFGVRNQVKNENAPVEGGVSGLPDGWTTAVDEASGNVYYVNEGLKKTQWEVPTANAVVSVTGSQSLPVGWTSAIDEASGNIYYVNTATQTTQWEIPTVTDSSAATVVEGAKLPEGWSSAIDAEGKVYYINTATQATQWEFPSVSVTASAIEATKLPEGWSSAVDADGKVYYINTASQTTQWEFPSVTITAGAVTGLPEGWTSAIDSETGKVYYVNPATQAAQWEFPNPSVVPVSSLPDGWAALVDESGKTYYFNSATQVSQWELPSADSATNAPVENQAIDINVVTAAPVLSVEELKLKAKEEAKRIALEKLSACASAGNSVVNKGCKLLFEGLKFGEKIIEVQQILQNGDCLNGVVDFSAVFSFVNELPFAIDICPNGVRLSKADGAIISLSTVLKVLNIGTLSIGGAVTSVISAVGLSDVSLKISVIGVNNSPRGFMLQGQLIIAGSSSPFSLVLVQLKSKWIAALDIVISASSVNTVISKSLGSFASVLQMFEFKDVNIVVSSGTIDLSGSPALQFSTAISTISRGFSLFLTAQFSATSTNPLVIMFRKAIPTSFSLSVSVDDKEFSLNLLVPDVILSSSVSLRDSKLFIKTPMSAGSGKPSVGFSSSIEVKLQDDVLKFFGSVSFDATEVSVTISLRMEGVWKKAFGIKRLSVSNLGGKIGLSAIPPYITKIGLDGTATIGDESDPKPVVGTLSFMVNMLDPTQNYFYGSLSSLTINDIFNKILGLDIKLPSILGDSGFDKGLEVSYASLDQITDFNIAIPAGHHFKGGFNLFGYHASMDVLVGKLMSKFEADFDSLNLGFLVLKRSENDLRGPHFSGSYNLIAGEFAANIQAYINCFVFKASVTIKVTPSSLSFSLSTNLFMIFAADISVNVKNFNGNFGSSVLDFSAVLKLDIINQLRALVLNVKEVALQKLQIAKNALKNGLKELNKAKCGIELDSFESADTTESTITLLNSVDKLVDGHMRALSAMTESDFEQLGLMSKVSPQLLEVSMDVNEEFPGFNKIVNAVKSVVSKGSQAISNVGGEIAKVKGMVEKAQEEIADIRPKIVSMIETFNRNRKSALSSYGNPVVPWSWIRDARSFYKGTPEYTTQYTNIKVAMAKADSDALLSDFVTKTPVFTRVGSTIRSLEIMDYLDVDLNETFKGSSRQIPDFVLSCISAQDKIEQTTSLYDYDKREPLPSYISSALSSMKSKGYFIEVDNIVDAESESFSAAENLMDDSFQINHDLTSKNFKSERINKLETLGHFRIGLHCGVDVAYEKGQSFSSRSEVSYKTLTSKRRAQLACFSSKLDLQLLTSKGVDELLRILYTKRVDYSKGPDADSTIRELLRYVLQLKYYKSKVNLFLLQELEIPNVAEEFRDMLVNRIKDQLVPVVYAVNKGFNFTIPSFFKANILEELTSRSLTASSGGLSYIQSLVPSIINVKTAMEISDAYLAYLYKFNPRRLKEEFYQITYELYMPNLNSVSIPPQPAACYDISEFTKSGWLSDLTDVCADDGPRALQIVKNGVSAAVNRIKEAGENSKIRFQAAVKEAVRKVEQFVVALADSFNNLKNSICQVWDGTLDAAIAVGNTVIQPLLTALDWTENVVASVLSFLDTLLEPLSRAEFSVSLSGVLGAGNFKFSTSFHLGIRGIFIIDFNVELDFSHVTLESIVSLVWQKVKSNIIAKIPGLSKLL